MSDAALLALGLTKRYGRHVALDDCTLDVPAGHVVGLVGPNGAGKTTLLQLAAGLLSPTAGTVAVLGERPASSPEQLAKVAFVAQDTPTYTHLSVADHLRLGAAANPRWDRGLAQRRVTELGLDPRRKAGRLSGGQRAQLALTMALAKRPELLLLDEPVASLDPMARRDFLKALLSYTAEHGASVVLSSHLVSDLERFCDHVVVLVGSHVRVAGDVDDLLASHFRLTGDPGTLATRPEIAEVVESSVTGREATVVVRADVPPDDAAIAVEQLTLDDLVLAYLAPPTPAAPTLEVTR